MGSRVLHPPKRLAGFGKIDKLQKSALRTDNCHMGQETKKQVSIKPGIEAEKRPPERYIDDSVKDYDFSNFVKVTAFQWGLLLSFGKIHPSANEILKSQEILLPFDVAGALADIIQSHLNELEEKGLIQVIKKDREEEAK